MTGPVYIITMFEPHPNPGGVVSNLVQFSSSNVSIDFGINTVRSGLTLAEYVSLMSELNSESPVKIAYADLFDPQNNYKVVFEQVMPSQSLGKGFYAFLEALRYMPRNCFKNINTLK
ncbi:Uncharacterised protein [uncultured archaeon]|nr:Uncharacterised protein [uncultured archaeon]